MEEYVFGKGALPVMLRRFLCLFLALLMLTGCSLPGEGIAVPTTNPTETTAVPVTLEAVNQLAFRAAEESPEICVLDERTVAFLTTEYVPGNLSQKHTRIQVVDLYTDALTAELVLEENLMLLPLCSGGMAGIFSAQTNTVRLLDRQLQQVAEFAAQTQDGVLTEDLAYYYYVYASELYRTDTQTGDTEVVTLDWPLPLETITGYDPEQGLLLVDAYANPYATDTCVGAIDLATHTFMMVRDDADSGLLTASGVCFRKDHPEQMTADAVYVSWDGNQQHALPDFFVNDVDYSTSHISGSDYVFQICFDKAQKSDIEDSLLLRLGETVSSVSLQPYLKEKKLNKFVSLPEGNLLALYVTRRGYQPFLICPDKLEFTDSLTPETKETVLLDEGVKQRYQQTLEGKDLPPALQQVRQTANRLQEEYGITILLSSQCAAPATASTLSITTSDQAGLDNEAAWIRDALDILEDVLEMYPEGFFFQFQNEAGERGILLMLVEDIGGGVNAVGVSYQLGQWYPVAVDITHWELESTYYHEFWHATENKINAENPELLSDAVWSTYNPPGFSYSYDQTGAFWDDLEYTLMADQPDEETYFVDGYGKTNAHEDRARLMEYTMFSDRYARMILKRPAMRKKITLMAAAIREVFDTTGWGKAHWERYL